METEILHRTPLPILLKKLQKVEKKIVLFSKLFLESSTDLKDLENNSGSYADILGATYYVLQFQNRMQSLYGKKVMLLESISQGSLNELFKMQQNPFIPAID